MDFNRTNYTSSIRLFKTSNVLILAFAVLGGIGLNRILGLWDNPTTHVMGLLVGGSLFVGIIIKPEVAIWGLVIIRSCAGTFLGTTTLFPGAWNINVSGILNFLVIFAGVYYIMVRKINLFDLSISKPFLMFIVICLISILPAPDKITALRYCVRFTSYFMLYVVTITVLKNKKQIVNLIRVIFLSAIVPVSIGFYQMFTGTKYLEAGGLNRILATFTSAVQYGYYLMILFPFALLLFLFNTKFKLTKYVYGLICLPLGISLIQTFTRGAWIGIVIALIIIGLRYKIVFVLLALILIMSPILFPNILLRLSDLGEPGEVQSSSFAWRVNLWKTAFPMIKSNLLMGNGLGSFLSHSSVEILSHAKGAHSVYLRLAMEVGLLGLGAYLWLLFKLGKNAIRNYMVISDTYIKALSLGFISIFVAYVIVSVADNFLEYVTLQWHLWFFAAITEAGHRIERSRIYFSK